MNKDLEIADWARQQLEGAGCTQRAAREQKYMKSEMAFHGAPKPFVNKLAKSLLTRWSPEQTGNLLRLVERLWHSPYYEERSLGIGILAQRNEMLCEDELTKFLYPWLETIDSWGHLDEYCIRVLGNIAIRDPSVFDIAMVWCDSKQLWVRRAALIVFLPTIRKTGAPIHNLDTICARLAAEREFFIRKAIGWVLRELADRNVQMAVEILLRMGPCASGLTIRVATRKLPRAVVEPLLSKINARSRKLG